MQEYQEDQEEQGEVEEKKNEVVYFISVLDLEEDGDDQAGIWQNADDTSWIPKAGDLVPKSCHPDPIPENYEQSPERVAFVFERNYQGNFPDFLEMTQDVGDKLESGVLINAMSDLSAVVGQAFKAGRLWERTHSKKE